MISDSNKTYEIYLNKKLYKVSYLIYMCHATGCFNKFETLDVYVKFFVEFRFNCRQEVLNYLKALGITHGDFRSSLKGLIVQILKGGLVYAHIAISNFEHCLYEKEVGLYINKLRPIEILNAGLNYIKFEVKDDYLKLAPYLKFYKTLSSYSNNIYIKEDCLNKTFKYLNIEVNTKDIQESLLNHSIIFPYKNNYVWSSKYLLQELKSLPIINVNMLCINYLCSNLNINA